MLQIKKKRFIIKIELWVMVMKRYIIGIFILTILFILVIGTPNSNYAKKINTDITSNSFKEQFDPLDENPSTTTETIANPLMNSIVEIVNSILGVIQVIGGVLTIISIAFIGFSKVISIDSGLAKDLGLNAPNARKSLLDHGRLIIVGSILLFFSATFVRLVFALFNR